MTHLEPVEFLRHPDAYPDAPREVAVIETHMSWVFLAGSHAYKLKKPVCVNGLDLGTPEGRRRNCAEEVHVNRRLAPDVYIGVLPVTLEARGALALAGRGEPVDWLVYMRRLSADDMLDAVIGQSREAREEAYIRAVARRLGDFYASAPAEPISADAHRKLLAEGVDRDVRRLSAPRYGLPVGKVKALAAAQFAFIEQCALVFGRRIYADRIVDGHGDLRPEHICLRPMPAIIDCLEFDKQLRVLDPVDELAFLALECERLGSVRVGQWFLETYTHTTGDEPPRPLLHFYRVYRAMRRATIAAAHLDDPAVSNPDKFAAQARHYLEMVEPVAVDPLAAIP